MFEIYEAKKKSEKESCRRHMTKFLKPGSTYVPSDKNAVIAVICTFLRVLSEFSYVLNIESSEK